MKKINYKLFVLFFLFFFSIFDAKAEIKDYFKLPGGEIIVPSNFVSSTTWNEGFTCDYTNGYASSDNENLRKYKGGIAITFRNSGNTEVVIYTGDRAETGNQQYDVSIQMGEVHTYNDFSDFYLRDNFMKQYLNGYDENRFSLLRDRSYHFELNIDSNTSIGKNSVQFNTTSSGVTGSFCPAYLYIYADASTVDGRDSTFYNFTLSNNEIVDNCDNPGETTPICTSCIPETGFNAAGCKYVCAPENPRCDTTGVDNELILAGPKNIYKFINNGQSVSEQDYRKQYCTGDECNVDVDAENVDGPDTNVEETPIEEEFPEETNKYLKLALTCNYETQFIAIQKEANGNPTFDSGEGCVKADLQIQLFKNENTDEYEKIVFYNNLSTGIFSHDSTTYSFCKETVEGCDAHDESISYINIEDFIDPNNSGKCVDNIYWLYDDRHMYIFPIKKLAKEYSGLDFIDCDAEDADSEYCKYFENVEQEDKKRLFTGVLKSMVVRASNGSSYPHTFDNESTCPIDKYEVAPEDVPEYDPEKYEIVFNCESLGDLVMWLSGLFIAIQVASIILTVVLTALDVMKAISSFDDKNTKKVWNRLLIRLIAVALLFILKPLCIFLLNFFGIGGDDASFCI